MLKKTFSHIHFKNAILSKFMEPIYYNLSLRYFISGIDKEYEIIVNTDTFDFQKWLNLQLSSCNF
jgi:hypothetical protein